MVQFEGGWQRETNSLRKFSWQRICWNFFNLNSVQLKNSIAISVIGSSKASGEIFNGIITLVATQKITSGLCHLVSDLSLQSVGTPGIPSLASEHWKMPQWKVSFLCIFCRQPSSAAGMSGNWEKFWGVVVPSSPLSRHLNRNSVALWHSRSSAGRSPICHSKICLNTQSFSGRCTALPRQVQCVWPLWSIPRGK